MAGIQARDAVLFKIIHGFFKLRREGKQVKAADDRRNAAVAAHLLCPLDDVADAAVRAARDKHQPLFGAEASAVSSSRGSPLSPPSSKSVTRGISPKNTIFLLSCTGSRESVSGQCARSCCALMGEPMSRSPSLRKVKQSGWATMGMRPA